MQHLSRLTQPEFSLGVVLLALAFFLLDQQPTSAATANATFTINSTVDATDANPGDGICETQSNNSICTLRAAIMETNVLVGADNIFLPAGLYTLTIAGVKENGAAFGDLDIYDDLIIQGDGVDTTIIDGGNIDRLFEIVANQISVTLDGVALQHGSTLIGRESGGGILNRATLFLHNCLIRENTSEDQGAAIYNKGILTIDNCIITQNHAVGDSAGSIYNIETLTLQNSIVSNNSIEVRDRGGGGIESPEGRVVVENSRVLNNVGDGIVSRGELHLFDSEVSGNSGRGIYAHFAKLERSMIRNNQLGGVQSGYYDRWNDEDATTTIVGCTIEDNRGGGGLYSTGPLTIRDSTIISNSSTSYGGGIWTSQGFSTIDNTTIQNNFSNQDGGGIFNDTQLIVSNSKIAENHAVGRGGGLFNSDGDLYLNITSDLLIKNSTISHNRANDQGGGIYHVDDQLFIVNSTISTNHTQGNGGALFSAGDEIVEIHNATIVDNSADGTGGGIYNDLSEILVGNTILANNMDHASTTSNDCFSARPLISLGTI